MSRYNIELGKFGELVAETYLVKVGARVLARNYRSEPGEIDLVVEHEGDLVAVEVKTRTALDGRPVPRGETAHQYLALNKPLGVVSTAHDPEGRRTVVQLVHSTRRLYPVGRLDIDSEGLVLLTDDGELTFRLTHARFGIEKEYHVVVTCSEELDEPLLERLRRGVMLEDGPARAVRASIVRQSAHGGGLMRVVLVEGRQRQV